MLKLGDRVNLVYYEGESQVGSYNWLVEEYDNGLLKVTQEPEDIVDISSLIKQLAGYPPPPTPQKRTAVFNLRSIGFLKAELADKPDPEALKKALEKLLSKLKGETES